MVWFGTGQSSARCNGCCVALLMQVCNHRPCGRSSTCTHREHPAFFVPTRLDNTPQACSKQVQAGAQQAIGMWCAKRRHLERLATPAFQRNPAACGCAGGVPCPCQSCIRVPVAGYCIRVITHLLVLQILRECAALNEACSIGLGDVATAGSVPC